MNGKDVKKLVELQGKIIQLRRRIDHDIERHNSMVLDQLRPMSENLLHNTIYQVGDMTYKRGRVFCQLECKDYGLGVKAEGLATVRRVVVEDTDAPINDAEG